MEIGSSVASSIAESAADRLFDAAGHQLGYLFHHNDNIESLKQQVEKLEGRRDRIRGQIEAAERNLEIIEIEVQKWMTVVDEITTDAKKFLEEEVRADKRCLSGWCINLKSRYKFGKEAKQKTLAISQLHGEGNFEKVSHPAPPPGIVSSFRGFSGIFESRESIKKDIMQALNDDNVRIIGICGMGGVGKTTLVKELGKRAKDGKLYDEVVMTVVSQTPNISKIREELANVLGLERLSKTQIESERTSLLLERMKKEKRMLVILDDVWGRIEMDSIGIPLGNDCSGCKIVLTSRSKNVCNQMDCQKIFVVGTLLKQESWELFKELAGSVAENSDISPIAREVAAKCGGLPIAIVTIARALKNQNKDVWMDAALQLKNSLPADIEGMQGNVISSLELSYNYLPIEGSKSLFLFCSLFPEDFNIPIEDLVRYGTGLRWFKDHETMEHIRVRTRAVVSTLVSSFLLIAGDGFYEDCVKMHDVVRDFALTIAPKYNHKFMVKAGIGLKEWPNSSDTFEDLTAFSLMSNSIHEVPDGLNCPKLQASLLQDNYSLEVVSNTSFQGMKDLKVLDLSETLLFSLPDSFSLLANLRTLYLNGCNLDDLSVIGMLSNLEILSLRYSNLFTEIPISFRQLSRLRFLDLYDCRNLFLIPEGVISCLRKLEELYMINSFGNWDLETDEEYSRRNARLVELQALSRITSLQIYIPNPDILPDYLPFENLNNFILEIGLKSQHYWAIKRHFRRIMTLLGGSERYLKRMTLSDVRISSTFDWVKSLLKRTEDLTIYFIEDSENVIHALIKECLKDLKSLCIIDCKIKYLLYTLESTPNLVFHNLEVLKMYQIPNLVEICYGRIPAESFSELKHLKVANCRSMLNVVSSHLLQRLQYLQIVNVGYCRKARSIFDCEGLEIANGETKMLSYLKILSLWKLDEMTQIWKGDHQFISLHNLKELQLSSCPKLSKLFSPALLQNLVCLEEINIKDCRNLEEVFGNIDHTTASPGLGNLANLCIQGCNKLKNIFTSTMVKSLLNLGRLELCGCSKIKDIVTVEEGEKGALTEKIVFPSLVYMRLRDLDSLTCFSSGLYVMEFPALEEVIINGCRKMKTFGYGDQVTPKLNKVVIQEKLTRWSEERWIWNGNINDTVKQIFNEQVQEGHNEQTEESYSNEIQIEESDS